MELFEDLGSVLLETMKSTSPCTETNTRLRYHKQARRLMSGAAWATDALVRHMTLGVYIVVVMCLNRCVQFLNLLCYSST